MTAEGSEGCGRTPGPVETILPTSHGSARVPLVYSSAHSGRIFPADFRSLVDTEDLRVYEDRLVDELIADASRLGVHVVLARFARAYIDPNRSPDDLDEAAVAEGWTGPVAPTDLAARGIGLIFRVLPDGRAIYDRPLGHAELRRRLDTCWRPFHAHLADALAAARDEAGRVWHIDWHSMRPVGDRLAPDPGATRRDFVVSDREGRSADPAFTGLVAQVLRGAGFSVAINRPFTGGYIIARHGDPARGRQSVQVEINRRLYLDPSTLDHGPGFATLRDSLAKATAAIAAGLPRTG
jgi:N-formylglutamate deformylase